MATTMVRRIEPIIGIVNAFVVADPLTMYLVGRDFDIGERGIVCTTTVFPALMLPSLRFCVVDTDAGGAKLDNDSPVIWNGCTSFRI